MKSIVIELSFDDIVNDMFANASYSECGAEPSGTFSEEVKATILHNVAVEIRKAITDTAITDATKLASAAAKDFIDNELQAMIKERLMSGVFEAFRGAPQKMDDIIAGRIGQMNLEKVITARIDAKAKLFADEMKVRYDNIFAMRVVQGLNKQKLLSPEVAKMLLGEEDTNS